MKVLWSWLLELCDLDRVPTVEDGARVLTRGGIEIENVTDLGVGFTGVVVAEVVAKRPHPQADKLTLVDVIVERGGAATQVVCGAPNVPEPGRKVLWAQIGATLPGGLTLAAKPVKGVVSPGMLCAEDELGLSTDHAGIVVLPQDDRTPLGAPAQRALGLDDHVLEVKAYANRGDLLGHLGIARELVAIVGGKVVPPDAELPGGGETPALELRIASPEQCPRYSARVIEGLRVGPSPARIAQRLRAVGVRPISNLVDVTNYVLFELGQPLHAFDAAKLTTHTIAVSSARDGERLVTLDNQDRALIPGDLVIRDGDRPVALAGVMGGRDTEVTDGTRRVLLESASFQPLLVRRTARRLGLHSEASHRFERGVDPELAAYASARATRLLCQHGGAGAHAVGGLIDAYAGRRSSPTIRVRLPRVRLVTGVALDEPACTSALERLGFAVRPATPGELDVTPPSPRADVTREVDVIEEILRVTGYDQVPNTLPALVAAPPVREPDRGDLVRRALAAAGASEAITYGFQSAERCGVLDVPPSDRRAQPIALHNPMTVDQAVMRTSLVPNLLAAVVRNASFGRLDVNLFEVGSVFWRRGEGVAEPPLHELADEPPFAAGVLTGRRPVPIGEGPAYDVFDAKALALAAIRVVIGDVSVRARATHAISYLHPGVAGELVVDRHSAPPYGGAARSGQAGPFDRYSAPPYGGAARSGQAGAFDRYSAPPYGGAARSGQAGAFDRYSAPPYGGAARSGQAGPFDRDVVGWFGEVHPRVRGKLGIAAPVFLYEVPLAGLRLAPPAQMTPIPRFPGSARDVSLLLAEHIPAARVRDVIADVAEPLVTGVRVLEDYRDAKLPPGMKSMLWSIAYRAADRTLTDAEVDRAHEAIVARLVENLPAQRR